jgi:TadE-like protein
MRLTRRRRGWPAGRGQALTEFALVFPLFMMVLFGLIVVGLYVFYNQQLANAARESARYAAIHSSTAQCPTVSSLDPIGSNRVDSYYRCDTPAQGWPRMVAAGRSSIWGMAPTQVLMSACWSGYVTPAGQPDALPEPPNTYVPCRIGGLDPDSQLGSMSCPPPARITSLSGDASGDDKASALAFANGRHYPTTVTVYSCFQWQPPMAGFLLIPNQITLRAVVTEALQRQQ